MFYRVKLIICGRGIPPCSIYPLSEEKLFRFGGGVFLRFLKPVNAFFIDYDLVMSFKGGQFLERGQRVCQEDSEENKVCTQS